MSLCHPCLLLLVLPNFLLSFFVLQASALDGGLELVNTGYGFMSNAAELAPALLAFNSGGH